LAKALAKIPADQLNDEDKRRLGELADLPELTILHIIYQQKAYEGHAKDYEFSGTSMREHWQSGYDARSSVRNGWPCRPRVRACSSTTCTGSRKIEQPS
jgi:NTE family protein